MAVRPNPSRNGAALFDLQLIVELHCLNPFPRPLGSHNQTSLRGAELKVSGMVSAQGACDRLCEAADEHPLIQRLSQNAVPQSFSARDLCFGRIGGHDDDRRSVTCTAQTRL